ncbi:MAG TPA: hypothetical protein V6C72_07005, partial [Chroococcales cyanobacterium]
PDGLKQLQVNGADHTAKMLTRGSRLAGTFTTDGATLSFTPNSQSTPIVFKSYPNAIIDSEGTILYLKTAGEGRIIDKMYILAMMSGKYYAQNGHYPRDLNALSPTMQALGYVNPFTAKSSFPVKKFLQGGDKSASDIDLNDFQSLEAGLKEFGTYSGITSEPGIIEFFSTANAPEGESMYIRGTDRDGKCLRASNPSQNFVIVLVQGTRRRVQ